MRCHFSMWNRWARVATCPSETKRIALSCSTAGSKMPPLEPTELLTCSRICRPAVPMASTICSRALRSASARASPSLVMLWDRPQKALACRESSFTGSQVQEGGSPPDSCRSSPGIRRPAPAHEPSNRMANKHVVKCFIGAFLKSIFPALAWRPGSHLAFIPGKTE